MCDVKIDNFRARFRKGVAKTYWSKEKVLDVLSSVTPCFLRDYKDSKWLAIQPEKLKWGLICEKINLAFISPL